MAAPRSGKQQATSDLLTGDELTISNVTRFYESDVVIDTFNRGFAGRWHTTVVPNLPTINDVSEYICHLAGIKGEHYVLDFGSGVGVTTCDLARVSGARVRGLNISKKQIRLAAEYAAGVGLDSRVSFEHYPGREFPYLAATFDRVTFFESPCHVPHKELLFSEMLRVLRPQGICVGQDWMLATPSISSGDYARYIRPIEIACEVQLQSLAGYRSLMEAVGFVNISTIDAREIDPDLALGFAKPSNEAIEVRRSDSLATRLSKGNIALSNAFHQGLFTIGFVVGHKRATRQDRPDRGQVTNVSGE
jgi:SAM-dependent methyltransferase